MTDWTVREARRGDGRGLAQLHLETAKGYVEFDPSRFRMPDEQGLVRWIDDDLGSVGDDWMCFVAVADEQIVGQVEVRCEAPLETARHQTVRALGSTRGYVNSLAVSPSHRRRGIGRALIARAEGWLIDNGAVMVALDTLAASPDSVPFYESLGYRANKLIFERELGSSRPRGGPS